MHLAKPEKRMIISVQERPIYHIHHGKVSTHLFCLSFFLKITKFFCTSILNCPFFSREVHMTSCWTLLVYTPTHIHAPYQLQLISHSGFWRICWRGSTRQNACEYRGTRKAGTDQALKLVEIVSSGYTTYLIWLHVYLCSVSDRHTDHDGKGMVYYDEAHADRRYGQNQRWSI